MKALENHPVVAGVGLILALLSIVSIAVTVWVFLEAERVRNDAWLEFDKKSSEDQLHKLESIQETHGAITETLIKHSGRIEEIEDLVKRHWAQREDRFEELETEHKMLLQAFTQSQADINFRIGVHSGRHMEARHRNP